MSLIRVYPQHWFSPRNAQQPEQSFQPLDRLHHDIDRLFNGFFTPGWPTSLMEAAGRHPSQPGHPQR